MRNLKRADGNNISIRNLENTKGGKKKKVMVDNRGEWAPLGSSWEMLNNYNWK